MNTSRSLNSSKASRPFELAQQDAMEPELRTGQQTAAQHTWHIDRDITNFRRIGTGRWARNRA